ncbi:hypothetical protein HDU98_000040 [Podochytrium sp. JEL0797]|nr:hypothetical protein HDU98_000040 [Podochytrium sp. JEL0797]
MHKLLLALVLFTPPFVIGQGSLTCCDLCNINLATDPCGYSTQYGQLSCALGGGFCQSSTCDNCTLLTACESCTSNGQCTDGLACNNGQCSNSASQCSSNPTPATTAPPVPPSTSGSLTCCDLCNINTSPDLCGYSTEYGQLSCALGGGFCQSSTCDNCTLLTACDSCTSDGQCTDGLGCNDGQCSNSSSQCSGNPAPTTTANIPPAPTTPPAPTGLSCCDLCNINTSPDLCGFSAEYGQLSCALGGGFCQSSTCNSCTLLTACDSCTSDGQCTDGLGCNDGQCSNSSSQCSGNPAPTTTANIPPTPTPPAPSNSPTPSTTSAPFIGYWNDNLIDLPTACSDGYDILYFYNVINFGYDYPDNPQGILTNSVTNVAACQATGVKVVLVLGGGSGSQQSTGYSISNGATLAPLLWSTYFASGQFDGASFDIEGLYGSGGTGQDLADIINYFRQQAGSDWIISLATYGDSTATGSAQPVVRAGIAGALSSISFLNVQSYDVSYNDFTQPSNDMVASEYNGWVALTGLPINIGVDVCVTEAVATLPDVQNFASQLSPPPNGLFIWTCSCANANQQNGVAGLGVDGFESWVHGSFPNV